MSLVLGIDTSCYTTAIAVMDIKANLLGDYRQLLSVPEGEKGLQQSRAVFQHVQNMASVFAKIEPILKEKSIIAVAASTRPRSIQGSYMPVFTVSEAHGRVLSSGLGVPFWETSHQEGHLLAGLWSSDFRDSSSFLAVHISGGTSELLHVIFHSETGKLKIDILGSTQDLHAGQFVDRVGVTMGLPFPAGPALEKLGQQVNGKEVQIPSAVDGYNFSFSGSETCAQRLWQEGIGPAAIARGVESCIAKTLEKVVRRAILETGLQKVLFVGGVAANKYLRERLAFRLEHRAVGAKLFFATPALSTDNAVGVALSGVLAWQRGLLS